MVCSCKDSVLVNTIATYYYITVGKLTDLTFSADLHFWACCEECGKKSLFHAKVKEHGLSGILDFEFEKIFYKKTKSPPFARKDSLKEIKYIDAWIYYNCGLIITDVEELVKEYNKAVLQYYIKRKNMKRKRSFSQNLI